MPLEDLILLLQKVTGTLIIQTVEPSGRVVALSAKPTLCSTAAGHALDALEALVATIELLDSPLYSTSYADFHKKVVVSQEMLAKYGAVCGTDTAVTDGLNLAQRSLSFADRFWLTSHGDGLPDNHALVLSLVEVFPDLKSRMTKDDLLPRPSLRFQAAMSFFGEEAMNAIRKTRKLLPPK